MDTILMSLSSEAGVILLENMDIVEVVSMFSIGAYNALETAVVAFNVFDRYRGLYFWSMQIASWGIVLHSISAMVRFVNRSSGLAMSIPFLLGWCAMVTGQAVVLYSRLHLVVFDRYKMRWALWMIIINAVILHIPMSILFLGIGQGNTHFARAAAIYDRIQLTGFCIQDLVLCGTYIRQAARIMKPITRCLNQPKQFNMVARISYSSRHAARPLQPVPPGKKPSDHSRIRIKLRFSERIGRRVAKQSIACHQKTKTHRRPRHLLRRNTADCEATRVDWMLRLRPMPHRVC